MKRKTTNHLKIKKINKKNNKKMKKKMLCGLWSIKLCLVKNFVFEYPLNQILEKKFEIFQFTKFSEFKEVRDFFGSIYSFWQYTEANIEVSTRDIVEINIFE